MNKHIEHYAVFLKGFLKLDENLSVVFDSSNGSTGPILRKVFESSKNIEAHYINETPDGNFPAHSPNPLMKGALEDLKRAVVENSTDVGIIFDADGDRMLLIDNKGEKIDAVETISLLAEENSEIIVSAAIGKSVMNWVAPSLRVKEARVGSYFIKKALADENISFGGEKSGHYYFEEFFHSDSGILAAIFALNKISKLKADGKSLNDWHNENPRYFSEDINLEIEDKKSAITSVEESFSKEVIEKIDGISVYGEGYWLNVRPSNTEPLLRISIAAKSEEIFEKTKESVINSIK